MAHIRITALGGVDENGKNSYVLEINDDIFVINTGAKIPVETNNGIDTVIPDFSYLEKNIKRIKGIFITDVKNDSFSALPWFLMKNKKIEIYSSPFNSLVIKNRIDKYKIGHNNYKINKITKPIVINGIEIKPIPLAGSMPGLNGYDFKTKDGHITFLFNYVIGDLGIYGKTNLTQIKKYIGTEKIIALVIDAGKANVNGYSIDKIKLPNYVEDVFEKAKNNERIIVGAYDEEMFAIDGILKLASKFNRPVITYGKTYGQLIYLISKVNKNDVFPKFVDYKLANKTDNAVILVTSTVERLYQRFLRITDRKDVFLKLKKSDNVIMLAPPINGIESIAAVSLDDIARITPKLININENEFHLHRPYGNDIIDSVKILAPENVIPVMGLYRYMVVAQQKIVNNTSLKSNNILIPQNGKVFHFIDGKLASQKAKIKEIGDVIIDGFGNGDVSTEVIREREIIGKDGLVTIGILFSNQSKKIVGNINVNFAGVVSRAQKTELTTFIKSNIAQIIKEETFSGVREIQERIRKFIRKRIFKLTDKEPMVIVTFYGI